MPFVAIIADLSAEFGWAPDAWRRLTWRELQAWIGELARRRTEEAAAVRRMTERADIESRRTEFFRSHGIG